MIPAPHEFVASVRRWLRERRLRRLEARAARRRNLLDGRPIVAVTGAAGKSTAVQLLTHLLGGPPRVATPALSNDTPSVLRWLAQVDPGVAAVVSEVSEYPVGTLARVGGVLRPTMAVLTISGLDHFSAFRTRAASAAEIAMLARAVPPEGLVLLNADHARLVEAIAGIDAPVVTFGTDAAADYRAIDCGLGSDLALSLTCVNAGAEIPLRSRLVGTLSDYAGDSRRNYRKVLKNARPRSERAIFLRHSPRHVGATPEDVASGRVLFFDDVRSIASRDRETAVPGEVILLKGSFKADHLERIPFDFLAPVRCWEEKCGRGRSCLECDRLGAPADLRPVISLAPAGPRRHAA